ncbi:hypothetical protein PVAP13_3KG453901 [Panicum virgatum]|uniref:Uncharacterized protein n=1 Tax=Panicum virgatum TaxID=38727 RepID=A0A8T0VA87_PANVG|nr:hypothetical protein PVAP13_3KG453901 [Panicum virgatum]
MRPSAVRTLQTWRLEQCSGEEVQGAVRPAELPRLGGAAPAGGTSQARRSSAGVWAFRRGGAEPAGGPSGGEEQSRRVDLQAGAAFGSGKCLGGSYPSRARPQLFSASRARRHVRAHFRSGRKNTRIAGPPAYVPPTASAPNESAPSRRRALPRRCARLGPQLAP